MLGPVTYPEPGVDEVVEVVRDPEGATESVEFEGGNVLRAAALSTLLGHDAGVVWRSGPRCWNSASRRSWLVGMESSTRNRTSRFTTAADSFAMRCAWRHCNAACISSLRCIVSGPRRMDSSAGRATVSKVPANASTPPRPCTFQVWRGRSRTAACTAATGRSARSGRPRRERVHRSVVGWPARSSGPGGRCAPTVANAADIGRAGRCRSRSPPRGRHRSGAHASNADRWWPRTRPRPGDLRAANGRDGLDTDHARGRSAGNPQSGKPCHRTRRRRWRRQEARRGTQGGPPPSAWPATQGGPCPRPGPARGSQPHLAVGEPTGAFQHPTGVLRGEVAVDVQRGGHRSVSQTGLPKITGT